MQFLRELWNTSRRWLDASPWRMEIAKLALILAISYFIMSRRDFGFTETPYNFF